MDLIRRTQGDWYSNAVWRIADWAMASIAGFCVRQFNSGIQTGEGFSCCRHGLLSYANSPHIRAIGNFRGRTEIVHSRGALVSIRKYANVGVDLSYVGE